MQSKKSKIKTTAVAICFILPFFILYTLFTIWPVLQGIYVSFHKWSLMGKQSFIGLDNYTKFIKDKNFWNSLGNTCTFVVITVPLMVVVSMCFAMLANRPTKLKKGLRIAYYLPSVLSVSVASFVAKYMFSPYRGFINGFLHSIGVLGPNEELLWFQDRGLAWISITSMTVWWTVGFSMLLYLSALQDISPQIMEAASIDGAKARQKLFYITLPLLKPTTYLIFLLQMIACFKVFGQIFMITGGGPAGGTRPLIQYIYEAAFAKGNMGYAAAMSYALFFILIVLSLMQQFIQRKAERE